VTAMETITVEPDEADLRLDRWFRRRFPALKHGRLERLLRTGQVRVDGRRVKSGYRLSAGEAIRVPPVVASADQPAASAAPVVINDQDRDWVRSLVLHRDDDLIAIDKPPGLAVQGGTGTYRHLDGLLDGLRFDGGDRPRLVHRLDKDTSGVLLLARSVTAAARLAGAFRDKAARKLYWALAAGVPEPQEGVIESALVKAGGVGRERMQVAETGRVAATRYKVRAAAAGFAWLEMLPVTGRTHQLRVHAAQIGTPIVGDRKYGGTRAVPVRPGIAAKLHLHAREITVPHPAGGQFRIVAPLPPHMRESWRVLGFDT